MIPHSLRTRILLIQVLWYIRNLLFDTGADIFEGFASVDTSPPQLLGGVQTKRKIFQPSWQGSYGPVSYEALYPGPRLLKLVLK